jgi:hypothetical protein
MRKISFSILVLIILTVLTPLGSYTNYPNNIKTNIAYADDFQSQLDTFRSLGEQAKQAAIAAANYAKSGKIDGELIRLNRVYKDAFDAADKAGRNARAAATTPDQIIEVEKVARDILSEIDTAGDKAVDVEAEKVKEENKIYRLLAPIGNFKCIDPSGKEEGCAKGGVGEYLNILVLMVIGICGILAVVMLVINFIGYMSSESFTEKAKFKEKFWGPIGGLLLALGAYAILMTINPSLTGKDGLTVENVGVSVEDFDDMPEGGDLSEPIYITGTGTTGGGGSLPATTPGVTCASGSKSQGFCMIGTYDNPKPTGEIPQLVSLLKSDPGYKITKINIIPTGSGEKFIFTATKGSETKEFSTMGIGHGSKGWSNGDGYSEDSRTPYGTYKIINKDKAKSQDTVLRSTRKSQKTGIGYSMGGAKFNLNIRGIAIHSNQKNSTGTTAACILMYNDDLFALYPYISANSSVQVVIGGTDIKTANANTSVSSGSAQKLCTDVASCQKLCTTTNNGNNYTGNPPGLLNPNSATALTGIPLVEARCKDCNNVTPRGSPQMVEALKRIDPAVKELIAKKEIPNRKYNFRVYSAFRSAKDQIRVMCIDPKTGGTSTIKSSELGSLYAYPATSNHGTGTAVDFKFYFDNKEVFNYGTTRSEGSIEKILDKAGLQRLISESWHFQTNTSSKTCKYPSCPAPKYTIDTTLEV